MKSRGRGAAPRTARHATRGEDVGGTPSLDSSKLFFGSDRPRPLTGTGRRGVIRGGTTRHTRTLGP